MTEDAKILTMETLLTYRDNLENALAEVNREIRLRSNLDSINSALKKAEK